MESKYIIVEFTNEETGFKYFLGGQDPTKSEVYPGFCIDIIKYHDGTYGARLYYGPYDYVKEEF